MPLHHPKENQKRKESKINIKLEKLNKRKEKLSVSKAFYNTSLFYYFVSLSQLFCSCHIYYILKITLVSINHL